METNIIKMDAVALRLAQQQGKVTVPEITAAYLDRIEAVNPAINAIISMRSRVDIMTEAEDMQKTAGSGLLFGLPIAIKDLRETKGIATTFGSLIYKDNVPSKDCLMVERIRSAGALIIGKTNTPEFGFGSHSYNLVHGVTVNPYDLTRSAGGSSGGAGAALAAGMLPIADGSDMMGSLRNPAGWNNVYGFRPSYGLVPDEPAGENFLHQLSTSGPMARTVRDLELLLKVMGVPDARLAHATNPFTSMGDAPVKGTKIGWVGDWGGYYPIENGVLELCGDGLNTLSDLGCDVQEITPPFAPEELWQSWTILRQFAAASKDAALFENPATRALLKPEVQWEIENGLALSARDVRDASMVRSEWFRTFAMLNVDMLTLPSAQMFPFDAKLHWPKQVAGRNMDTYHRWMEVVVPAALIGLPALSIPVGFGDEGLPMGLQLIGKRGCDAQVLRLGHVYHEATLYPQKYPPKLD